MLSVPCHPVGSEGGHQGDRTTGLRARSEPGASVLPLAASFSTGARCRDAPCGRLSAHVCDCARLRLWASVKAGVPGARLRLRASVKAGVSPRTSVIVPVSDCGRLAAPASDCARLSGMRASHQHARVLPAYGRSG